MDLLSSIILIIPINRPGSRKSILLSYYHRIMIGPDTEEDDDENLYYGNVQSSCGVVK